MPSKHKRSFGGMVNSLYDFKRCGFPAKLNLRNELHGDSRLPCGQLLSPAKFLT